MGKRQKDMCPFNYWRGREGNSECTGVVNVFKVRRQKDICMGKSKRDMCPLSYWSVVNVIKVWRQKDICMGKKQKDMCPFRYWRSREGNSDCIGICHQSPETKKKKVICRSASSFEARP